MSRLFSFCILALLCLGAGAAAAGTDPASPRYLAFQIFTGGFNSEELRLNFPPAEDWRATVDDVLKRVGSTGSAKNRLGFILGPLAFDHADGDVRAMIEKAFEAALATGLATGFHLDDSMFWGRLAALDKPENIEWLDWSGTPNTGRRLDWSTTPTKIKPQLCLNSKDVRQAVASRAALIGEEVVKGLNKLEAVGRRDLFIGVIAGWETMIGRDFETDKYLGYCALANAGFSAAKPAADIDRERTNIVRDFIAFWAESLVKAGVPEGKVYSHIAFPSATAYQYAARDAGKDIPSYLQAANFSPPDTAFCKHCVPGFSTYPVPGHLEQWAAEVAKHGNSPWASSEGTAIDPAQAERGGPGTGMETYLGNLYNHGAQLVNIFGWGVGEEDNGFRRAAESEDALAAYRKFLNGEMLREAYPAATQFPPADLPGKIHKIQAALPAYIEKHGPDEVKPMMEKLDSALKKQQFTEAAATVEAILTLISK